jgi:hypothetical protein
VGLVSQKNCTLGLTQADNSIECEAERVFMDVLVYLMGLNFIVTLGFFLGYIISKIPVE